MCTPLRSLFLFVSLVGSASSLQAFAAQAQQQEGPPPVTAAARAELVERLAELVTEHYVFPEVASEIAAHLRRQQEAGAYDRLTNAFDLANRLTAELRHVNGDKHFNVRPVPPGAFDGPEAEDEPDPDEERVAREARREQLRRRNFGFQSVEILAGNVGYVDLRQFVGAEFGGPTAVAAMGFLSHTDAVLFDLRQNGGGSPTMIQLLTSYFFEEPTHLNSFFLRGQEQVDQFWTLPHVPGPKLVDTPVYVLTSGFTGSAAEEFTYNLKHLERATIVGETTGGAAHPGGMHPATEGFAVFISNGRAINPITGTNWEGVGVKPHVDVPADEALATAHLLALEAVAADLPEGADRQALDWALVGLRAEREPVTLAPETLAEIAGTYGPRRLEARDGALYYSRDGRPGRRLVPLAADLFALEGFEGFRIRIGRDAAGRAARIVGLYEDGRRDESPRDAAR